MSDTVRLRYSRSTARYWVFERPHVEGTLADVMAVVHLRQRTGERPDWIDLTLTPGRDQPQVVGGRWVEEES